MFVSRKNLAVGIVIGLLVASLSGYSTSLSGTSGIGQRMDGLEEQIANPQDDIENTDREIVLDWNTVLSSMLGSLIAMAGSIIVAFMYIRNPEHS